MKNYEISEETLYLESVGEKTKIIEKENIIEVDNKIQKIMENSCEYFGSSFEGRKKGTTNLIGVTHKSPIIIEETRGIIFFPTTSHRLEDCIWISLNNLKNYYKSNSNVVIEFNNGQKLNLNISYGVIDNQILRASRLDAVLRIRKHK